MGGNDSLVAKILGCVLVGFVLIAIVIVTFEAGVWNWLSRATNASAVEAVTAVAQLIFAGVLVAVTLLTLRENATMARAAEEQRQILTRPIVLLRLWSISDEGKLAEADEFRIEVINVGSGPALDLWIRICGSLKYQADDFPSQPAVLPSAEQFAFTFRLDRSDPFLGPMTPRAYEPDKELLAQAEEFKSVAYGDKTRRKEAARVGEAIRKHRIDFYEVVADEIANLATIGNCVAMYRDTKGNYYKSKATIFVGSRDPDSPFRPNWSTVTLGSITFSGPQVLSEESSDPCKLW